MEKKEQRKFFELSLKRYNYLSYNTVFPDMRNETLELYSLCLGPFPAESRSIDVVIQGLHDNKIKKIFSLKDWEQVQIDH